MRLFLASLSELMTLYIEMQAFKTEIPFRDITLYNIAITLPGLEID